MAGIVAIILLELVCYVFFKQITKKDFKEIAFRPNDPYSISAREAYPYLIKAGMQLNASGVWFYDMTQIFHGLTEDIYTDHCCHFGKKGNKILAREIAKKMAGKINLKTP